MSTLVNVIVPLFSGVGALGLFAGLRYVARILRVVSRVEAQVHNNGGSSMKDAVDRIERRQKRIEKKMDRQDDRIDRLEAERA